MKARLIVLTSVVTLSCMAFPLRADQLYENAAAQRDRDETLSHRMQRLEDLRRVNHILGMEIKDEQGERLGKVKDLALDMQNGRIAAVIVASGGLMGMGQKLVAVPPSAFAWDDLLKEMRANVDKEQLKNAPEFRMSHWKEATDYAQIREDYQRFGVEPWFAHDRQAPVNNTYPTAQRGQASTYYAFDGQNALPQLGCLARASKVLGMPARNLRDEKLGKVDNLVVDLPAGRVVEVILASGGFMGIHDELSAVPPQSFKLDAENTALTLDTTKEALRAAPHFKSTDWASMTEPMRITEVYSIYRIEPYFITAKVDDTAQNARDRSGNTPTPTDQGNSEADRHATAEIRKAILADKSMSSNARNVKIITRDGSVTLRGPVDSEEEKRLIGEAAANVVTARKVDNQIEVRTPTPASTDSIK